MLAWNQKQMKLCTFIREFVRSDGPVRGLPEDCLTVMLPKTLGTEEANPRSFELSHLRKLLGGPEILQAIKAQISSAYTQGTNTNGSHSSLAGRREQPGGSLRASRMAYWHLLIYHYVLW